MSRRSMFAAVAFLSLPLGCASSGPVVPAPPSVHVSQFESTVFKPDAIKFLAKVVIENEMRARLNIDKVVYGANVHDKPVFTETFAELHPISTERNTVFCALKDRPGSGQAVRSASPCPCSRRQARH